ncbi:hypothetical protein [Candidatus Mesenet endosymbiont of Phosphuga atrata]|uniref:hypothetical protein n=1 Tax=Candidatus Mesenet endosymbiont of Phosphuga atrata TaxID=3066221 RepID=UPI0030CD2526
MLSFIEGFLFLIFKFTLSLNILSVSFLELFSANFFSSITLFILKFLRVLFLENSFDALLFKGEFILFKVPFLEISFSLNELLLFSNSLSGLFSESFFPTTLFSGETTVLPIQAKASPMGLIIDLMYSQKLAKKLFTFSQLAITRAAPVTSPALIIL